ncbi:MAG TPA: hypothetical protein VN327_04450 [Pseudonocardiaceae bacterium]|nr:hypothetical protein [Pseudonocardiaceae bacterium]
MRYHEEIGLRGSPRVAQHLASLVPGAASTPERLLAQGLQSAGLTGFLINEPVLGYIVLRYTAHDIRTRLGSILDEIAEVLARTRQPIS